MNKILCKKRGYAYLRVSEDDGMKASDSIELQMKSINKYRRKEDVYINKYFLDEGVSGASSDKPQLDTLLKKINRRVSDCVIVSSFDRIARDLFSYVAIKKFLAKKDVQLIAVQQQDIENSMEYKLANQMIDTLNAFESRIHKARQNDKHS